MALSVFLETSQEQRVGDVVYVPLCVRVRGTEVGVPEDICPVWGLGLVAGRSQGRVGWWPGPGQTVLGRGLSSGI